MVLNSALWMINDWVKRHMLDARGNAKNTNATKTVGLFVATDITNLHQDLLFQKRISLQMKTLKANYDIDFKILFSDERQNRGGLTKEAPVNALFDHNRPGWVGYPEIFLDQQLAACANIGFVGTRESSFSSFIQELRMDNLMETCDQDFESS